MVWNVSIHLHKGCNVSTLYESVANRRFIWCILVLIGRHPGTSCPDLWAFRVRMYQVMDDEDEAESTLQTISDATTTDEGEKEDRPWPTVPIPSYM